MVTLIKYGALSGGEKYNVNVLNIDGLSTDTKPTVTYIEYGSDGREVGRMGIPNGSIFTEIDTGDTYMYDVDATTWHKVSIGGGGGGTQGGIVLVGETTTALTDEATTNPITVDGQSYTAQPNDAVIYGSKEFLFDGTKWHEFGDLSGLASKDIGAMTGYAKASTGSAIATTDTLNQAIGKVEKRVDVNENNILMLETMNGAKNLMHYDSIDDTRTTGTIIAILNSDMTITINGTSGNTPAVIGFVFPLKSGEYWLNGCPTDGSFDTYSTDIRNQIYGSITYGRDTGSGGTVNISDDGNYAYNIRIAANTTINNMIFKPMLIPSDIKNAGFTDYQPYALSNAELTEKERQNENNILSEQAKTTGMTEGGSNYITVGGIRVYVSATAPTGARTGDLWIGG